MNAPEQTDQHERMDALARMAGGVAHEFNNVLTVILGYSDLLTETLPDNDGMRPVIADIAAAARRGRRLTRDLMLFSGWQPVEPEPVSIAAQMTALSRRLQALMPPQIAFAFAVPDPSLRVMGDPDQISEMLTNLAAHAIEAMRGGGTLQIEVSRAHVAHLADATGAAAGPGDHVMIRVRDSGVGMDAATRQRLFEPFFTTGKAGKGAALRMAVVFGIVKTCGGFLRVHSAAGEGSTVEVYLPVAADAPAGAAKPIEDSPPLPD